MNNKMNNVWYFLKEFESKDIVKRFFIRKYNYSISANKALEINSAFTQGREYFFSSQKADISVRPLLQYYGVVALSRGLILILDKNSRENNIIPSHGLKIKNWSEVSKSGRIEDITLKSSRGTFTELIKVTNNKTYLKSGSSDINWQVGYDLPGREIEFCFKEIAFCFPDLKKSVEAWLNIDVPSCIIREFKYDDDTFRLEIQGNNDEKLLNQIFPKAFFKNIEIEEIRNTYFIVKLNSEQIPNLCQQWETAFPIIGEMCVAPPFKDGFFLNDISTMYSASFILGTISRYYPSAWNNINKGICYDSVLPFAMNFMGFIQTKFPRVIMDFINSPYDFENKD